MAEILDEKRASAEHFEQLDKGSKIDDQLAVHLPESIRGLSESEIESMHKKITRKIDILLLPTLVILYIL